MRYAYLAGAAVGADNKNSRSIEIKMNIICFPHAGASSTAFFQMKKMMPPSINMHILEYPGRGKYFKKPLIHQFQKMIDFLVMEVQDFLKEPLAFLGHSMGALLSFETARQLRQLGMLIPAYLFISGRHSPQADYRSFRLSQLPDEEFSFILQKVYKGIPEQIHSDLGLMKIFLPILKADFSILENYQYVEQTPLPCEIIAVAGDRDHMVKEAQLNEWAQHTSSEFEKYIIPGDHFSIISEPTVYIQTILKQLFKGSMT